MLYTIVICDLIYKLQELKEIYNDEKAIKILNEIEEIQKKNPKSPDWESELIKMISERTTFFNISTKENILILQQHRHLSAHPVMDKDYELYSPNKETTRAHLRNMLEDILAKPPLISKDVFNELLNDTAEKREYFPPQYDNPQFEKYIFTKYIKNAPKRTLHYIFKNLWKFTFRLENENCKQNRDINYSTLFIIFKKNRKELTTLISKDKPYYSKIEKGNPCQFLISFISIYPEIYSHLEEHAKIIMGQETAIRKDYKIRAWYMEENLNKHVESLKQDFDQNIIDFTSVNASNFRNLNYLVRDTEEYDGHEDLINFVSYIYNESRNYYKADLRFSLLITPNLLHFTLNNIKQLLDGIEKNDQLYTRSQAYSDHNLIKDYIEENFNKKIKLDNYPNFVSSISRKIVHYHNDDDLPF